MVEGLPALVGRQIAIALGEAEAAGWRIVAGWAAPLSGERVVCSGTIRTPDDARRALLAAVSGAGLVVAARTDRETLDRFVDDLRRLGAVDHRPQVARRRAAATRAAASRLGGPRPG